MDRLAQEKAERQQKQHDSWGDEESFTFEQTPVEELLELAEGGRGHGQRWGQQRRATEKWSESHPGWEQQILDREREEHTANGRAERADHGDLGGSVHLAGRCAKCQKWCAF